MIHISNKGNWLEISMDRAGRRNALTHAMYAEMTETLQQAAGWAECRSIILSGAGGCFTAGNDLTEFLAYDPDEPHAGIAFLHALADADIPVIAAVEGQAVGVGVTMLQHCDFVLAGKSACFRLPFVPLGLCPEGASSLLLADIVGPRRAAQWLLTGQPFDASEALEAGLLTRVVEDGAALQAARATAEQLAAMPAASIRISKHLMRDSRRNPVHHAIDNEWEYFRQCLQSEEARSRIQQFFEGKPDRGPAGEGGEL
ncbi:enoyl-CoA hydratase-related protein [Paracandidimonas soli]|uniref:enoyl-CoA hydratase-related protein n=1 Tax=Paracandidimonas soli TaxID=1917182 RepID=UPI00333F3935